MLGKLLKYEFKATSRWFLIMYTVFFVITIFSKISLSLFPFSEDGVFEILLNITLISIYLMYLIAMFVMSTVLIIKRFYDNMLKEQGYLSFTLPVSTAANIFAKLISAAVWMFAFIISVLISAVIMLYDKEIVNEVLMAIRDFFEVITEYGMQTDAVAITIGIIIYALLAIFVTPMMYYACMAIGQLFNKHKILGSLLAYGVIYVINQTLGTIITVVADFSTSNMLTYVKFILGSEIFVLLLWGIASTITCIYIFDKKLNLE